MSIDSSCYLIVCSCISCAYRDSFHVCLFLHVWDALCVLQLALSYLLIMPFLFPFPLKTCMIQLDLEVHHHVLQSPSNRCKPRLICANSSSESVLHSSLSSSHAAITSTESTDSIDSEWSEHICPDGYPYYYNCVTCESRVSISYLNMFLYCLSISRLFVVYWVLELLCSGRNLRSTHFMNGSS